MWCHSKVRPYRTILEVDIVCLKIHISELGLQRRTIRSSADERSVEIGGHDEDSGLCVVDTVGDECGVEDVDEIA